MRHTLVDLRAVAKKFLMRLLAEHATVGALILTWNKGEAVTPIAVVGDVEPARDVPRMLREVADQLEQSRGKLVV